MTRIFAAATLLFAMTACGGSSQKELPLEGTTWKLARMESIPASAVDAEEDAFTLEFNAADTLVAGRTNCNRFFGKYERTGKSLKMGPLGMMSMMKKMGAITGDSNLDSLMKQGGNFPPFK